MHFYPNKFKTIPFDISMILISKLWLHINMIFSASRAPYIATTSVSESALDFGLNR